MNYICRSCFSDHEYPGDLFSIYEVGKTVQSETLYHWSPSGHPCGPVEPAAPVSPAKEGKP